MTEHQRSIQRIGVISDTHGVVHPAIAAAFANVDAIVHAGDIGGQHVLDALRAIAPITSVEGNNDEGATGEAIVRVTIGTLRILLTHILPRPSKPDKRVLASLRREPADVVIFGHSHLPHDEIVDGVRYFNPASSGPRRFDYPTSVGLFEYRDGAWSARHVALDERSEASLKTRMNQLA